MMPEVTAIRRASPLAAETPHDTETEAETPQDTRTHMNTQVGT